MAAGIQVEGLNKLVKSLLDAGVELQDIKVVFADIAAEGAKLARGFAPHRTGKLEGSIKGNKAKNKATVQAGSAKVPYAKVINYGYPRRGIAASHFLQKADDALKPRVKGKLEAAIEKLLAEKDLA